MYTARGSVRGDCGHEHYTLDGARKCAEEDRKEFPDSDRTVCAISGRPLEKWERDCLRDLVALRSDE